MYTSLFPVMLADDRYQPERGYEKKQGFFVVVTERFGCDKDETLTLIKAVAGIHV